MEDESEKTVGKPLEEVPSDMVLLPEESVLNENSNGVLQGLEDNSMPADELSQFAPSTECDESNSQGFLAQRVDAGDNAVSFQENSSNDGESRFNADNMFGNDSNPPRASAANTQHILDAIENTIDDIEIPINSNENTIDDLQIPINANESTIDDLQIPESTIESNINELKIPEDTINNKTSDKEMLVDATESKIQIEDLLILKKVPTDENFTACSPVSKEEAKGATTDGNFTAGLQVLKDELKEAPTDGNFTAGLLVLKDKPKETPMDFAAGPADDTQNISDDAVVDEEMKEAVPVKKEVQAGQEADTEVVSEDELPLVEKPRVQDAENVSDDELPGPRAAELPADTEVVSEDELPSTKKEERREDESEEKGSRKRKTEDGDYNPSSPTSDTDPSNKKQAVSKNGESKPVPAEKRASTEEKEKKKKALPELDKYWKVVNEDSSDFTGWTYLLQYVDQESDVEAAREAYDAFLSHYPYCYGYWRKYADYEKRKGSKKKCFEVLERGLKAIPLSVDLWIHYLNHIKTTKGEDVTYVRQQYDRAIEACGLEFRSDRLWESYIKWETEHGTPLHVTAVYDRLLATPTLGYTSHFDNFQEHVMSESVTSMVGREELVRLRAEVREGSVAPPPAADLPPGEDEPDDHIASEEEGQAIKERVIALRRKVHKSTGEQVAQRWTFEEGIKRPYFHVKPLERSQLKNWKNYLEWEKQHGSFKRALVLHERCLIACALYEEFWLRLVKFLEDSCESDPSLVGIEREALERACTVHHPDKPSLHLHWAYFEEVHGNASRAADILEKLDKTCPNLLHVAYRRINLERRRGDLEKCCQLYESYIASTKSKSAASALSIKYARFLQRWRHDSEGAQKVLADAIVKEPLSHRLYLQQLDIALDTPDVQYDKMSGYLEAYERVEGADLETSAAMARRRLELAEELGTAAAARSAYNHYRTLERRLGKRTRQAKHEPPPPAFKNIGFMQKVNGNTVRKPNTDVLPFKVDWTSPPSISPPTTNETSSTKKKEGNNSNSSSAPPPNVPPPSNATGNTNAGSYYPPAAPPPQPYDQPPYQQQYQPPWNHYQQHPPNPYHHNPWGQYPNYY